MRLKYNWLHERAYYLFHAKAKEKAKIVIFQVRSMANSFATKNSLTKTKSKSKL